MSEIFPLQPDEKLLLRFRKHWFVLVRDCVGTILIGILPFIIGSLVLSYSSFAQEYLSPTILSFASVWWLLIVWCALAIISTNHFLDYWIVTDRRIANFDQVTLFDRVATTWRLDRVQDVTVRTQNIFETLFGYGTVEVQTAGPNDVPTTIRGIRAPAFIQKTIMQAVEDFDRSHQAR